MINVVCVKWGTKYPSYYVNNLYYMVERRLTVPHRFICFTDDIAGLDPNIETRPFENGALVGWWQKLTLFKETVSDLTGTILFLDLDVVILQNIDELATLPGNGLFAIREFALKKKFGLRLFPNKGINSSVMKFDIGSLSFVWDMFEMHKDQALAMHGDQDWISHCLLEKGVDINYWPSGWCYSFKWGTNFLKNRFFDRDKNAIPADGKICIFHGDPNPHECDGLEWVKSNWFDAKKYVV